MDISGSMEYPKKNILQDFNVSQMLLQDYQKLMYVLLGSFSVFVVITSKEKE